MSYGTRYLEEREHLVMRRALMRSTRLVAEGKMDAHPQLPFIRQALCDLESLRDAATCNGPQEQRLAAYLAAACKCMELALLEADIGKR